MKSLFSLLLALLFCLSANPQEPLTNAAIIKLQAAGVAEEIIVSMVKTQPVQLQVGAEQVVDLRRQGVSDKVVAAMVARASGQMPPNQSALRVQDGTPVRLLLVEPLTSKTAKSNDPVLLELAEDVKVGDRVAVPKGSRAAGHIVDAQKAGRFGVAGRLEFVPDYLSTPGGTNIRLKPFSEKQTQQQKMGALVLGAGAAFVRGKNVELPKGTMVNASIDGDKDLPVLAGGAQ